MSSDREPQLSAQQAKPEAVRHSVVQAASEMRRGGDQAETELYLALLQDRLPIYVRTIGQLGPRVGTASVHGNLVTAVRATIDFYQEILAAKVAVFTKPAQLTQLRQVLRTHQLGPQTAVDALTGYLTKEAELGRTVADIDPLATARLLLGAAVNYAFTFMLMGNDVPDRDEYIDNVVRGMRLDPVQTEPLQLG